jgi:hypothetical protein
MPAMQPANAWRTSKSAAFASVRERTHDVDRPVAIEGRDLHRHDVRDVEEPSPELVVERNAANGGLKVEADHRDHLGHRFAVRDDLIGRRTAQGGQAHEPGVVA